MVSGGLSKRDREAAAALGFMADDYAPDEVALWPCCWQAVETFDAVSTQWRMGYAGPVGLDYAAVLAVMSINGVPDADRPALFEDLRVMEFAALEVFAEARD